MRRVTKLQSYKVTKKKQGFTLIEVMVATAVLAGGVVLIFQALFATSNTFAYYANSMALAPWMDQKIWELQEAALDRMPIETSGSIQQGARMYTWKAVDTYDSDAGLAKIALEVSWIQGKRQVRLQRSTYVFVPEEKEETEGNG